jgi:hypothetical protein
LSLADVDAAAYRAVLAARRRDEPGHPPRQREAQRRRSAGADRGDRARGRELAAAAVADARGGVRGEAITALVLAAGVARGGVPMVELNLASALEDPRRTLVRNAAEAAVGTLDRTLGQLAPAAS